VSGDSPWPVDPSEYALSLGADTVPLTGHRFSKHHDSTIRRLSALGFGQVDEPTGMRRLDPQRTSWTLRASARNGTACRPVHPFDPRVITPREAARLSGFPDSVDLSDNIAQAIADVGNAVPPPMSLAVALAVTQYPSAPQASGGLHRRNSLDRDVFQSPIP
jgi:DNA (cytosine-5)-methyltransferase 1